MLANGSARERAEKSNALRNCAARIRSATIAIAQRRPHIAMSTLTTRAAAQTAGLLIPFALIFVSAGTVHFWQGWLFCLSFWSSTIATGIYLRKRDPALLERRMRFGPGAESRPIQTRIMAITLAMFVAVMLVAGRDHRFRASRVPAVHG